MGNYIPNETKVRDEQTRFWKNEEIENLITAKNEVFKKYLKNNLNHIILTKIVLQRNLGNFIESLKQSYYKRVCQKLSFSSY